jgi:hypothetical protein
MHPLLTLLYCCAAAVPIPTPESTWREMFKVARIVLHPTQVVMEYDADPLLMVSLFHHLVEPSTLLLDQVTTRFTEGEVSSKVWGPAAWEVLHALARGPNHTQVPHLLQSWTVLLPCPECRAHLTRHLESAPSFGSTPEETYRYTVGLHNAVNMHLGKPAYFSTDNVP